MKVGDLVTGRHKGVGVIVAFGDEGVFRSHLYRSLGR